MIRGKRMSGISGEGRIYIKAAIGCIGIIAVNAVTGRFISDNSVYVVMTIALSVVIYAVIEIILKNEAVYSFIYSIKNKINGLKN